MRFIAVFQAEFGSYQPTVNCSYSTPVAVPLAQGSSRTEPGFESFRVHEMMIGPHDLERLAMAKHRLLRMLAPQTQENPIFFHSIHSVSRQRRHHIRISGCGTGQASVADEMTRNVDRVVLHEPPTLLQLHIR